MELDLRLTPVIGLIALLTGVLFALSRSEPVIVLSLLCVLLIVGSLFFMFLPSEAKVKASV